ncbi:ribosomal protein S5 domain 2-like protein [Pluteus cervinus]|uniref:Ribosomal protein S5 domain 2-like protein n=1 Tax=Pluteus cervinus TaxID=181527 RepID=A0ACD3AA09_9AGAR|nr:ribosomal protein S5 domain 2-like protein [Pluteus cervinus]
MLLWLRRLCGLHLTGTFEEVIQESVQIGSSRVKSHAYELGITSSASEQFLMERHVHAICPKEVPGRRDRVQQSCWCKCFIKGPGFQININPNATMIGKISLVGRVLPVGGLEEKVLAAHHSGIKTAITPAANRADVKENVPESVKTGILFIYVEHEKEVLLEVFKEETEMVSRCKGTLSS